MRCCLDGFTLAFLAPAMSVTAIAQVGSITNVSPGSNLLAPGSTTVALSFTTTQLASCRYSIGAAQPFMAMQPFDSGQPSVNHRGTVQGLSSSPATVNNVYLRCDSDPNSVTTLQYRSVANPIGAFPRIGSIWWGSYVLATKPAQAQKIQLYLCPAFNLQQAQAIRAQNPNAIIVPNVNATEATSFNTPPNVPEAYFLHDTTGKKIPNWPTPGDYILNLTKPEVADFMANYAYQVLLQSGLIYDGIFFDNFHTTISWLKTDYTGNPVQVDANGDGQPDDPATLDAAWSAGVYRLIATFRQLVPYGLVTGHLDSRPPQTAALAAFNGESLNGDAPRIREGYESFGAFMQTLDDWFGKGQQPGISMVQSSPPLQVAYGYGFTNSAIPDTQTFAQTFYPNMRFGLGIALMTDGFYTHDFGDTSTTVNWWYDEYDFYLGYPVGPATRIGTTPSPPPTNLLTNGGFESSTVSPWHTFYGSGGVASTALDTGIAAEGNASAHVTVSSASSNPWQITFEQDNIPITKGVIYQVQFWARSDPPRNITVFSQGGAPNFTNYGLNASVPLGPSWNFYTATFLAAATANDARLEFWLGDVVGSVWFDGIQFSASQALDLYRRDFTNGVVLLNAASSPQTITLEGGLKRFSGSQAPKYQYIVDDSDSGFADSGNWKAIKIDSGFTGGGVNGPGGQIANGPYYHAWQSGVHELDDSSGTATWNLHIPEDGTYTIRVWLPAAPNASTWANNAIYEIIAGGQTVASVTLDQTTASHGDSWHTLGTWNLTAATAPSLRIRNGASGPLIADAVYVISAALYNDGSTAAQVTLAPMDAILLQRQQPVPTPASRVSSVVNAASFQPAIASGGFLSIAGAGFGAAPRSWAASDFNGVNLPIALDGVSVMINGKPAYVEYISSTVINAIAPDDDTLGPVPIQVKTPQGTSYPATVLKQRMSPGLFPYQSGGTTYAVAVHLDGTLVGPSALSARPASPGEIIAIYATGFGPTTPPMPTAQLIPAAAPTQLQVSMTIGGAPADVQWAGLVSSGLYQLNIKIPSLASGDQPIQATISGFQTPGNLMLPIASH